MAAPITIVGAGSWGTTLAVIYARHGHDVILYDRDVERARLMAEQRENRR